jgi:hypothetical protein
MSSTFSGYGEEELVGLVCLSIYILGLSKEEQAMDKQVSSWTFEQSFLPFVVEVLISLMTYCSNQSAVATVFML